ncbi:hypothetical protein SK128_010234, partial [Halocaridina rubra]
MALQGITNCAKITDDFLLFDEVFPAHLLGIHQMLRRCCDHGMTLNKDNLFVAAPCVDFSGYTLIRDCISVDVDK